MITVASKRLMGILNNLPLVIPAQAGIQWRYSRVVAKEPDRAYETWRGKGE
jgi:hypothetical protein